MAIPMAMYKPMPTSSSASSNLSIVGLGFADRALSSKLSELTVLVRLLFFVSTENSDFVDLGNLLSSVSHRSALSRCPSPVRLLPPSPTNNGSCGQSSKMSAEEDQCEATTPISLSQEREEQWVEIDKNRVPPLPPTNNQWWRPAAHWVSRTWRDLRAGDQQGDPRGAAERGGEPKADATFDARLDTQRLSLEQSWISQLIDGSADSEAGGAADFGALSSAELSMVFEPVSEEEQEGSNGGSVDEGATTTITCGDSVESVQENQFSFVGTSQEIDASPLASAPVNPSSNSVVDGSENDEPVIH